VCWENAQTRVTERGWVKSAIENTWQMYSTSLVFVWHDICDVNTGTGIRIEVSEAGPHVKALGKSLAGMVHGMVLNFDFNTWSTSCRSMREYCIKAIAGHEFGHALGLAHEQNRPDVPDPRCAELYQGTSGDWMVTPYDLQSIMNYCNPAYSNNGMLSASDITAIVAMYPPLVLTPITTWTSGWYRIASHWQTGRSIDVINDGVNNQLALADSGWYSGQLWKLTHIWNGYYRLTCMWQGDGKAIDVINDGTNDKVALAATGPYSGQYWKISDRGNGLVGFTSYWQGDGKSLGVVNDGTNRQLKLAKTAPVSGQWWQVTPV